MKKDLQVEIHSLPPVYNYTDFRIYLKECFAKLKEINPSLSETIFVQLAGFGKNSRGYFSLLISGKRNLSVKSIEGFASVLKLTNDEHLFFETLVNYNQCEDENLKKRFLERLTKTAKGQNQQIYKILSSQYNYFSNWYTIAIRELVALDDFEESHKYIQKKLNKSITTKQIDEAINDLITIGLLERSTEGKLKQVHKVVSFVDNSLNYTAVKKIQKELLEIAYSAVDELPFEKRAISNSIIACDQDDFMAMKEDIRNFRKELIQKYCSSNKKTDCILSLGVQLFHLTEV